MRRVAYELSNPAKRLDADDKTVKLFRAFAPMLCKRPTKRIEDTVKLMGEKFILEEKLDGERMQLHKQGNEYFYCSRQVFCLIDIVYEILTYSIAKERTTPICMEELSEKVV